MFKGMLIPILMLAAAPQVEVAPGEGLTVQDSGQGQPVVLMPGLAGCAYGYRNVVPPLNEAGRQTIVIEPLGYGASSRPEGADYSLTAQADRIAAVLDSLALSRTVLVAHGVTASIAYRLAYRRPDLVAALVSLEGGPNEAAGTATLDRSLTIASIVAKLGGGRILRDRFVADLEAASVDRSWIDRKTVGRYLRHADRDLGAFIRTLQAMAASEEPESLHANLARIACPVVLVTGLGDHDYKIPDEEVVLLENELADFTIIPLEETGHFIHEERPEAVVQIILDLGPFPGDD